jgi:hypothetical protein
MPDTNWKFICRAMAAYLRSGGTDWPGAASDVVEHNGKAYVRLVNVNGTLAVYRIQNVPIGSKARLGPRLKRLKRWSKELDATP